MKKLVYLFLSIAMLAFIFGNSLLDAGGSREGSLFVTALVQRVSDWLGFAVTPGRLHVLTRKGAHFAEYALQGIFLVKAFAAFGVRRKVSLPYILLAGLLTAVIDENIQLYSAGRSGEVADIMLDFSGTLLGILVAFLTGSGR
ncbi:MAG: VanZ family protein [Acidaminococcaceae bacterium]|nr:VanZ family protein [Acidaminococcaceae bacterium]